MSDLEAVVADLTRIADEARWAYTHGWWKEGHGLDAEHGTDLAKTETERQAGPTYDIQVGSHAARVAYQHAAVAVHRADVLLAVDLLDAGIPQPPIRRVTVYSHPALVVEVCQTAAWRAEQVTGKLVEVRRVLDRAVRGLESALGAGTVYTAHKMNPCRTCGIRERVSRKAECDTCAKWRVRHDGASRPKELDTGPVNEARAAQARRLARGEGWGAA